MQPPRKGSRHVRSVTSLPASATAATTPSSQQRCTFVSLLGYEPSPLTIRVSVLPLHYREGHMPSASKVGWRCPLNLLSPSPLGRGSWLVRSVTLTNTPTSLGILGEEVGVQPPGKGSWLVGSMTTTNSVPTSCHLASSIAEVYLCVPYLDMNPDL